MQLAGVNNDSVKQANNPCTLIISCVPVDLHHRQGRHVAALIAASDAYSVCRRIGSDEEQQLLKSAKDDLNIASTKRQGMHLPAYIMGHYCKLTEVPPHSFAG